MADQPRNEVDSPALKIFVDARWTRTDNHDGISRYGASLIEQLHRLHPVTMLICDDRQLALLPPGVPYVRINSPLSPRELWLSATLHRLGADVVFSPLQVIGGFRRRYKLVLTLHDLIYYRHPQPPSFLPLPVRIIWRLYHKAYWPQRMLLNRADAVVTVSETTKKLIAENRLTRRPVTVVPNAPFTNPETAPGEPAAVPAPTNSGPEKGELVYMGSFMPYKNVETLIAGMAELPDYRLNLLSPIAPKRAAELSALVPSGADVVFWRGISDADYHSLLARASALVTASKDEGFGLPVIEAMNAGTPVVCSDLAIFREVTGGHAVLFAPDSPGDFVAAVRSLDDRERVESMVHAARAHAATFTWRASAKQLLGVLRSVAE